MTTKIKAVTTADHTDDHFVRLEDGKRLEAREVAGKVEFQVVFEESARAYREMGLTEKQSNQAAAIEHIARAKASLVKSYQKLGMTEADAIEQTTRYLSKIW